MDDDDFDTDSVCEDCGSPGEPMTRPLSVLLAMSGDYRAADLAEDVEVDGYECGVCGTFWGACDVEISHDTAPRYRGVGQA